ncbi:MAG TPA: helix-turn-helix domain-containing protein [Puia sp.]|nr:helix-turn-helix domain-containing protein [Puia sp.]
MTTLSFLPHPSISQYVSDIVVIENNHVYREAILPLIAKGYPSITFQVTDTDQLSDPQKKVDNLVLYGQNIKPIELATVGYVTVIAYFLYPYMLKPLFGFDAKEVTDMGIDVSLSQPARGMSIKEQLINTPSLTRRLELMNEYLLKLIERSYPGVNNTILSATQSIQKSKGLLSLTAAQKELHVTERTLQRLFESHIGVSPKMFSRICQFSSALQQLHQNQFSGMPGIAYENGYADQSHFIRAFKEFTHYSPLEYLRLANAFPR